MSDLSPDALDWIARFSEALGLEAPTSERVEQLLELAGVAAHASHRQAAPVSCFLAALAGLDPARATEIARTV